MQRMTLEEYYINRNYEIIKKFRALTADGNTAREAMQLVSVEIGVSTATVRAVMYNPEYSYGPEAHDRYNREYEQAN